MQQTINPKVSVIIPAYNCDKYIASTITSCIEQDYNNIEIIVVNDGSTDETGSIVTAFLSDSRVRLINQENKGVSAARNLGIESATGDYLTFLDSDDTLVSDTISGNVKVLTAFPDIDWLYFPIQRIDQNGNAVDEISPDLLPSFKYDKIDRITAADAFVRMSRRLLPTCVCGGIYRREFFDKRFKDGRFEDTIMVMELLGKHKDVILSPYGSYVYYDRSGSFINSEWDAGKWVSYINVLLATMQTTVELFPAQKDEVEKEKTRLYYTLRYLKAKKSEDVGFSLPLKHFITTAGKVRPSFTGWSRYIIKTIVYKCRQFVIQR